MLDDGAVDRVFVLVLRSLVHDSFQDPLDDISVPAFAFRVLVARYARQRFFARLCGYLRETAARERLLRREERDGQHWLATDSSYGKVGVQARRGKGQHLTDGAVVDKVEELVLTTMIEGACQLSFVAMNAFGCFRTCSPRAVVGTYIWHCCCRATTTYGNLEGRNVGRTA